MPSAIQGVDACAQPDGAAGRVGDGAALDVDELVVRSTEEVVEEIMVVVAELEVEVVEEEDEDELDEEEEVGVAGGDVDEDDEVADEEDEEVD